MKKNIRLLLFLLLSTSIALWSMDGIDVAPDHDVSTDITRQTGDSDSEQDDPENVDPDHDDDDTESLYENPSRTSSDEGMVDFPSGSSTSLESLQDVAQGGTSSLEEGSEQESANEQVATDAISSERGLEFESDRGRIEEAKNVDNSVKAEDFVKEIEQSSNFIDSSWTGVVRDTSESSLGVIREKVNEINKRIDQWVQEDNPTEEQKALVEKQLQNFEDRANQVLREETDGKKLTESTWTRSGRDANNVDSFSREIDRARTDADLDTIEGRLREYGKVSQGALEKGGIARLDREIEERKSGKTLGKVGRDAADAVDKKREKLFTSVENLNSDIDSALRKQEEMVEGAQRNATIYNISPETAESISVKQIELTDVEAKQKARPNDAQLRIKVRDIKDEMLRLRVDGLKEKIQKLPEDNRSRKSLSKKVDKLETKAQELLTPYSDAATVDSYSDILAEGLKNALRDRNQAPENVSNSSNNDDDDDGEEDDWDDDDDGEEDDWDDDDDDDDDDGSQTLNLGNFDRNESSTDGNILDLGEQGSSSTDDNDVDPNDFDPNEMDRALSEMEGNGRSDDDDGDRVLNEEEEEKEFQSFLKRPDEARIKSNRAKDMEAAQKKLEAENEARNNIFTPEQTEVEGPKHGMQDDLNYEPYDPDDLDE